MASTPFLCFCHFNGELIDCPDGTFKYMGGETDGFMVLPTMEYTQFMDELCERCNIGMSNIVVKYSIGDMPHRPPIRLKKELDYKSFLQFNATKGDVYISSRVGTVVVQASQIGSSNHQSAPESITFPPTRTNNSPVSSPEAIPDDHISGQDFSRQAPEYSSTAITRKELLLEQWANEISHEGQLFRSAVEFRNAIEKYCISNRFFGRYVVNNSNTYIKVCCSVDGCGCKIYGHVLAGGKFFVVYKFVKEHIHSVVDIFGMKRKATKSLVGSIFQETIRTTPEYAAHQIKKDFKKQFDITLDYQQAWRGKENAKERIHGKVDESYVRLPWYCNALVESNPGSLAFVEMDSDDRFRRCFISLKASIDGFLRGCRRILFIDGTHLKAKFKGTLLAATAPDANNGMFPVAFSIVAGETLDDWDWFLRHVKQVVGFHSELVIQSDRHPNIIAAVEEVFNKHHHSYCFRHIEVNVLAHVGGRNMSAKDKDLLKKTMWKAAFARLHIDYLRAMDDIRSISEEAHAYLISSEPEHWASSIFPLRRYDMLTSNHAESYNNWIREARHMPILCLIDTIRKKIMKKHMDRKVKKWKCAVGHRIEEKLKDTYERCTKFTYEQSSYHLFEVNGDENLGHKVDMMRGTCSCMEWYLTGLPCAHACTIIKRFSYDPTTYVDKCYTRGQQDLIYQDPVIPMVTMGMPQIGDPDPHLEPVGSVLPPLVRRGPGRPRKKRIESQRRRARELHCSICGENRHNRATCRSRGGPPTL